MNIKASVSKKKRMRGSVSMWIVAILCVLALALIVYNIIFEILPNYQIYIVKYIQ